MVSALSRVGVLNTSVTSRLLIDIFMREKHKVFVVFVDFSKAYDLVPRNRMFDIFMKLCCGVTMVTAVTTMHKNTTSILGSTVITSTIGV